ncbi:MAG: GDSL-type esterase/lipase family protein, partial [Spirochaetia bacterium]|nr:GDSL-type esterase/lipase family protein [Spirochaetia bacterium]
MNVSMSDDGNTKKIILCYGSSTTWGYAPGSGSRYGDDIRWPAVMKSVLGADKFEIIEEGLNGRTVLDHIPDENPANGLWYLENLLDRVYFDIIIILLGINDLFADSELPVKKIAGGIEKMINRIKFKTPGKDIIIISPPQIHEDFEEAYLYQSQILKSKQISREYKHISASNG